MPGKRSRPPGLLDGTEVMQEPSSQRTSSKSKPTAPKNGGKATASTAPKATKKTIPKAKPKPKPVQPRLKVGVDFGTTNSGVAYVMSSGSDAQDVEVIRNWPNGTRANEQLEKVPSRIAFKTDNEDLNEDKWGYDIPAGAQSYTWFKLHLDADAEKTAFDSEELCGKMDSDLLSLPHHMTAEEVAVTYLTKLYSHTMKVLNKHYTESIVKVTPIDFWFTVPATWQESATDATRTAAAAAGFGSREGDRLSIITEPEAAAIAVLSSAVEKHPDLIKVQKNILMCDLGGGTLDFQVLTITKVRPDLETEETIPGVGGKSGSTYIDCNFRAWASATFGKAFTKMQKKKIGTGSKFMDEWEVVKKSFDGSNLNRKYSISFPPLGAALRESKMSTASYDFEEHCILVTGTEIAAMFEPTIQKGFAIIDEICDKLETEGLAPFRIMCFCGGLGSSEYIWDRFKEYANARVKGGCETFGDIRAWSAVARGAATRGLSGSLVLSKRAKRAYGIGIHQMFREGVDDERDLEVCPVKGNRARGYVSWPIKIGQKFEENMRIKTPLYIAIDEDGDETDLVYKWQLFSCALDVLPDREDHANVKREGSITLDLSRTYKRSKQNDGSHSGPEAIKITIVFKMGNERGILMIEALHGTKVVGTAKIDYARTHARQIVSQSAGLLDC